MRIVLVFAFIVLVSVSVRGEELSLDQRLIVSCYRLDVAGVVGTLREGANVNARFGEGNTDLYFSDPWTLGYSFGAESWTPLMALAEASLYPDPPRKIANTTEDLEWAREQQKEVPVEQVERRRRDSLTILFVLLSHKADLDAADIRGATALYKAIDAEKEELAEVLIKFRAKVNTKTGIYIDGSGDTTPLHVACRSARLTKLLLNHGADPRAKDTGGKTPKDWAKMVGDAAVLKQYER
jgi:Ankyrin repeats (3 copies)